MSRRIRPGDERLFVAQAFANDRRSDSPATLDVPPTPDIAALETAAESLQRFGDIRNAIALWAIALRLREGTK